MSEKIKPTTPADTKLSTTMPSDRQQKQDNDKSKKKDQDQLEQTHKHPKKGLFDEFV